VGQSTKDVFGQCNMHCTLGCCLDVEWSITNIAHTFKLLVHVLGLIKKICLNMIITTT
jgi:hypothetical protein